MIAVERQGQVSIVRMDHGKVNALDLELLQAITRTMDALAGEPAVVLTGTGRAFSAGVDLRRIADGGAAYVAEFLPMLGTAFLSVFDFPRPVVAAVNGHAIAGGCVLVAACDLRLMSAGRIGLTELLVGVPFPTCALEIVRYTAGSAATRLILTGRTLLPGEAVAAGLVDEVVTEADLLAEAVRHAEQLATIPRDVYATTKQRLHAPTRERIDTRGPSEDPPVLQAWSSDRTRASIVAYLQRLAAR